VNDEPLALRRPAMPGNAAENNDTADKQRRSIASVAQNRIAEEDMN